MADLQASQAEMEDTAAHTADTTIAQETEPVAVETSEGEKVKREPSQEKSLSFDQGKGSKTDMAEKEKSLNEFKNQIRVCTL